MQRGECSVNWPFGEMTLMGALGALLILAAAALLLFEVAGLQDHPTGYAIAIEVPPTVTASVTAESPAHEAGLASGRAHR